MGAALYLDSRIVGSIHDSSADWGGSWIDADPFRPVTGAHRQERAPAPGCAGRRGRSGAVRARPPGSRTLRGQARVPGAVPGGRPPLSGRGEWRQGFRCLVFLCPARRQAVPVPVAGHGGLRSLQNSAGIPGPPSFTGRRVDLLGPRWRCRLAPTRPRSCTTTLLQHAPPPRKRWRPRQSCSSIPGSWPGKSPGSRALHAGTMCAVTNRGRVSCSACRGGGGLRARRAANLRTVTGMLVC